MSNTAAPMDSLDLDTILNLQALHESMDFSYAADTDLSCADFSYSDFSCVDAALQEAVANHISQEAMQDLDEILGDYLRQQH